jgi:uncharacterized membrane protein YgdD (TMEM256/DUF423 family)
MNNKGIAFAASLAFLAVTLGAFGAHGLTATFAEHGTAEIWHTAFLYHALHALALLQYFIWNRGPRWVGDLFILGIVVFSGSLYILAVTGFHKLGMVTPIGGILFLAAWLGWIKAAYTTKNS